MTLLGWRRGDGFSVRDRRALVLMVLIAFVAGYGAGQLSHTLPFARRDLGITEGGMFLVFAITRAASLLGLVFAIIADRKGRRGPLLVAVALLPIGNLLTAFAPGPVWFTVSQSVTRIAVIAVAGLAIVILAEELTPSLRALGLGIYALFGAMGNGLGLILLPIAENSAGSWRILFALTGIGLLIVPLAARFLKESRAYVQFAKPVKFRQALRAGLGRHFGPLAAIAFLIAAYSSPAFDFVLERMIDDLQWDTGAARFLLIFFSGIGALGLVAGGRLADIIGRKPTTAIAILLGLIGGVSFYLASSGWVLAPAVLAASFGAAMLTPAFAAHRSELFPTRVRATAAGWVTNAAILGSITGFLIGALLVDEVGLSATITILAIGLVIALFLVATLPETKGIDLVRRKADPEAATPEGSTPGWPSEPPAPTTPPLAPTLGAPPPEAPPTK
jgi:MFS family permease